MRALQYFAFAALLFATPAQAITINFTGTNLHDDDLVIFHYTVQNQGAVTIETTSWIHGGFIPILTLFDDSGVFKNFSDGYANNSDASLGWVSDAGIEYIVVLSQYDNYPNGTLLSDGFKEDGMGDFTTDLTGFPGPFRDPSGAQLTGDWAVTFTSAEPTLQATVPEPGTAGLLLAGALLVFCGMRRAERPQSN